MSLQIWSNLYLYASACFDDHSWIIQCVISHRRCVSFPSDEARASVRACVFGGVGGWECFSHAHAVVYHAAFTVPSGPDHAATLPLIGRALHTPLRLIGGDVKPRPSFPHRVWNDEWEGGRGGYCGIHTLLVSGIHTGQLLGSRIWLRITSRPWTKCKYRITMFVGLILH